MAKRKKKHHTTWYVYIFYLQLFTLCTLVFADHLHDKQNDEQLCLENTAELFSG